jgi:hypothetical protein
MGSRAVRSAVVKIPPMPRKGSIASDAHDYLSRRREGATLEQIRAAVTGKRGEAVLPHSVRSAVYRHLGDEGERLFTRLGHAKYTVRK